MNALARTAGIMSVILSLVAARPADAVPVPAPASFAAIISAPRSGWQSLPENGRRFIRALLDALGYDTADPDLVVNEFQAYLMQQPLDDTVDYFRRVAVLVPADIAQAVDIAALAGQAAALSEFTTTRFGISAGGPLLGPA